MNVADSERVAALLEGADLQPAAELQQADVVILNSCVVRQGAEDKVAGELGTLKGLKKRKPGLLLGLMGCMVTDKTRPTLETRFPQVDVFFNVLETNRLIGALDALGRDTLAHGDSAHLAADGDLAGVEFGPETGPTWYPGLPASYMDRHTAGPTRYVPIVYGCNMSCSFCIIPSRRGRERSRPLADIVAEVQGMTAHGVREVTLLGQTVDAYGHDLPPDAHSLWPVAAGLYQAAIGSAANVHVEAESNRPRRPDLADLLLAIDALPDIWRVRFLTAHPLFMSDRILAAVAGLPKACECINIPVQAGDDAVLKAMRRGYKVDDYRRLVEKMRRLIPGVAIATDLIVGFPGETDERFQSSYRLVEEVGFDVVHAAAFSPRPGTVAAALPDDVPLAEKKSRLHAIEALQEGISQRINSGLVGQTVEILVERQDKGKWMGRTRGDKIVFFEDDGSWLGELARVRIDKAGPWSLQGSLAA